MVVWRCNSCGEIRGKALLGTPAGVKVYKFCAPEDMETLHELVEEEEQVDACI